jgi:hypothetical protein
MYVGLAQSGHHLIECNFFSHHIGETLLPVSALTVKSYALSREATNTNFIVFGLTWPGLEPMIYHIRGEQHANHYTHSTHAASLGSKWDPRGCEYRAPGSKREHATDTNEQQHFLRVVVLLPFSLQYLFR